MTTTTAESEDLFDLPQTCHPSTCRECWRTYATTKRCQTPGTEEWEARSKCMDEVMYDLARKNIMRKVALRQR